MSDLEELLDALDAIHARRQHSVVVVAVEGPEGFYAEFWADGPSGLAAELVADDELAPQHQLSPLQEGDLRARGWDDETGVWRREWPATPDRDDRQRVAYETLRALGEVYGATGEVRVEEIGLEGEDEVAAPEAERTARLVGFVAAAVLALLGVALAVFLGAP